MDVQGGELRWVLLFFGAMAIFLGTDFRLMMYEIVLCTQHFVVNNTSLEMGASIFYTGSSSM